MAESNCRTCLDTGIIFDKNDLAIPCPMCDAWMEPETSVVDRQKRNKGKGKKKQPKKVDIDITKDDMGDFFDDLYGISDDDNPDTWGKWWDEDDDFDFDTPLRPVEKGKGQQQIKWWEDPDDPFGPETSPRGRNPRPIQNREPYKMQWKPTPKLRATEYVKDVEPRNNPDDFEYDTRWFNDDLNQHILHTVRKLTDAYPVTKNWFRGIRVSDVPPTACVVPNDRAIWLTPSFLDKPNASKFKRTPIEPDDDRLDRLIAHEFGHVLHASILADSVGKDALPDLDMNDLLSRNYKSDSLSHPDSPATYIMEEGKKKVKDTYITGYGETDELERFAEAMTEHWTNPRPPELASYVGQNIDFMYHRDKGLNKANNYESWWDQTMEKKEEKENADEEYKKFWTEVTGRKYQGRKHRAEKRQRFSNSEETVTDLPTYSVDHQHGPIAPHTIMEFISDPDVPKSWDKRSYIEWWQKKTREQYEKWWGDKKARIKKASVRPDVLYHVAPMKSRDALLSDGIAPTFVFANEIDAKVSAHEKSDVESQDIYYIDPDGLDISPSSDGWQVNSSITIDNIMQIEGWDEAKGHPLERLAAHEDDHEAEMKHAGTVGDVDYFIASCKCGWSSNIRSAQAAQNAWQRHSDSLNEGRRRDLAGRPATPERFRPKPPVSIDPVTSKVKWKSVQSGIVGDGINLINTFYNNNEGVVNTALGLGNLAWHFIHHKNFKKHKDRHDEEAATSEDLLKAAQVLDEWKSITIDSKSQDMIGYGYGKQGSTQHAEATRPRQGQEALLEVQLRAPEGRLPQEHSSVRNAQEVLRKRAQEAEGTIEDRFHPQDRVFLDADENWPIVDDVADAAQIVAPEAGAVRDAGEIDGALGSARSAYLYGAHSDIFDTVADIVNNIQSRQAITNGNKRAATLIGRTMLENAGYDTTGWDMAPDMDCPICYGTGAITEEGRAGMALGTPCDWCVNGEAPTGKVHPVARLVYGLSDAPDDVTHDQSEFAEFMRRNSVRR